MTNELQTGDKVPAFRGVTAKGPVSDVTLQGAPYVLYFYPRDDTPGCTTQACDFRDNLPQFKRLGIDVYGVSKDDLASHAKFTEKFEISFPLITDEDGSMCDDFGVWKEKSMYGKSHMGIERTTFLIDSQGIIRQIWRKVKVADHVDEVLAAAKALENSAA
jgi:thioredoxin-dependent peroxiredoxin